MHRRRLEYLPEAWLFTMLGWYSVCFLNALKPALWKAGQVKVENIVGYGK